MGGEDGSVRDREAFPPEVEMRDEVEQDQAEGDDAGGDAQPREHEPAFVPARRRRGDSKHEVQPSEYFCEEIDHGAPEEMRRYGGSAVPPSGHSSFPPPPVPHHQLRPRAARPPKPAPAPAPVARLPLVISPGGHPVPVRVAFRSSEELRALLPTWITMRGRSGPSWIAQMLPKSLYKHLLPALLAGFALRLFFIWHFPFYSGDTAYYEELARNWLYHGVYGFYSHGQRLPSYARAPAYPAFLPRIYFLAGTGRKAVILAQAFVDLGTCVLAAGIPRRLAADASDAARSRVAAAALWLTALCPFTANYAAVPLTEILAIFFTTLALLIFLSPDGMTLDCIASNRDLFRAVKNWFAGGLVVGLGTLVRPETPLLLGAILLVLWLRPLRPANWKRLTVATLWMIVGMLLPLAPWAARNSVRLGRVQFLAPRYAETYGDVLPTGFYAWTKTWMFRFRDAYLFTWKLPSQPIDLK